MAAHASVPPRQAVHIRSRREQWFAQHEHRLMTQFAAEYERRGPPIRRDDPDSAGKPDGERAYRVLIVEDDPDLRNDLADLLRDHGFEVDSAINGAEAYGIISASYILEHGRIPDVILLDLMLPRLSGPDFYRLLRMHKDLQNVPVVVLTGHEDTLGRDWVASLKKPVDEVVLVETVRAWASGERSLLV